MRYAHASVEIDGAKLRRTRKQAGLNIVQLADRVGVSFGYLAAVERGDRRTVSPARYRTILDALNITDWSALESPEAVAA